MSSFLECKCGNLVPRNLFCGAGISLVVPDDFLDAVDPSASSEDLVRQVVLGFPILLTCGACGRLILIEKATDHPNGSFFVPDN